MQQICLIRLSLKQKKSIKNHVENQVSQAMIQIQDSISSEIKKQVMQRFYTTYKLQSENSAHTKQYIKLLLDESTVSMQASIFTTFCSDMLPTMMETIRTRSNNLLLPIDEYMNDMQTEIQDTEMKVNNFPQTTTEIKADIEDSVQIIHEIEHDIGLQDDSVADMRTKANDIQTKNREISNDLQ